MPDRAADDNSDEIAVSQRDNDVAGRRPWRRTGLRLVIVIGVLFFAGLWMFRGKVRAPFAFAIYWLVEALLVLWLCALALKDILYSRRLWLGAGRQSDRRSDVPGDP